MEAEVKEVVLEPEPRNQVSGIPLEMGLALENSRVITKRLRYDTSGVREVSNDGDRRDAGQIEFEQSTKRS